MSWMTKWWRHARPIQRTTKARESLTDDEIKLIRDGAKRDNNLHCPDCDGLLCMGPEGGLAQNMACEVCHSEFNVTIFGGLLTADRISDKGPRPIGDRGWCYGLKDSAPDAVSDPKTQTETGS